jgi:hypothetical protein
MDGKRELDLFVCAMGFESRATAVFNRGFIFSARKVAFGFNSRKSLAFEENLKFFVGRGFEHAELSDLEFRGLFNRYLEELRAIEGRPVKIGVDISCFNRYRLSAIVDGVRRFDSKVDSVDVEFFYTLANYSPPSSSRPANVHVGPVSKEFAGWTPSPSLPPAAIVGLGYEQDKALGALEHLQIPHVIAFLPNSSIPEYLSDVRAANSSLLSRLDPTSILRYRVEDPVATYIAIESLISGLKSDFNAILLPFGPKIFFMCAVLAACRHDEAAIWRVSAGSAEEAVDRTPSSVSVSFLASFGKPSSDR